MHWLGCILLANRAQRYSALLHLDLPYNVLPFLLVKIFRVEVSS